MRAVQHAAVRLLHHGHPLAFGAVAAGRWGPVGVYEMGDGDALAPLAHGTQDRRHRASLPGAVQELSGAGRTVLPDADAVCREQSVACRTGQTQRRLAVEQLGHPVRNR